MVLREGCQQALLRRKSGTAQAEKIAVSATCLMRLVRKLERVFVTSEHRTSSTKIPGMLILGKQRCCLAGQCYVVERRKERGFLV